MIKKISHAGRKIFICCSFFIATLLALSNLAPYLNPAIWWIISLIALIFPALFILTIFFLILWLFIKPKYSILPLAAVLLSIPAVLNTFALNKRSIFNNNKVTGSLRVVTWNVGLLNFTAKDHKTAEQQNAIIFNKLKELDADVICLQEFFSAVIPGTQYNFIDSIAKTLGYPYYYFSRDNSYFSDQFYSGNIIYSKYKITDSSRTVFPDSNAGALIKTSLLVNNDTIHIFTTRLHSVNFDRHEYQAIDNLKKITDPRLKGSVNIIRKLKYAYSKRTNQINILTAKLNETRGPIVFAVDMNDVPTGYAYAALKKNRKDVWISNANGVGRTFKYISPTLRIDYIFINSYFEPLQTQRIISSGSDHYGLVTDIIIKKEAE
ncbi:MAG TPA: endonuclease/exonuclease/phosphatase family protein [Ferruginibacter sp.]|nr:endonuclease/exonuclease/phosphatase family protein [Ferruginibacter sp.]